MKSVITKMLCLAFAGITLAAGSAFAAEKEYEIKLPNFTSVTVAGDFEISIKEGSNYSVVLYVEEALKDYVQAGVKGTNLNIFVESRKIPAEIKKNFRGKGNEASYKAVITMPKSLVGLEMSEKAVLVSSDDVIDPDAVNITLSDNSAVNALAFKSKAVSVKMDKKASAALDVDCETLSIDLAGSASLSVDQKSSKCDIQQVANSNLELNGETGENLSISARVTSKAVLNGKAAVAKYNLSGTANVNAVNLEVDDAYVEMNSICSLTQAASKNLYINISNGASLTFKNDPVFHITGIKTSSVIDYDK